MIKIATIAIGVWIIGYTVYQCNDMMEELKYWRAAHPAEHAIAKQHGFKVEAEACLECW